GIAISDSFDGHFVMITTANGGATWTPISVDRLPPANEGEGAFASSGTCLVVQGDRTAWVGTGAGGNGSRILRTTDRGQTWTAVQTPIVKGQAAGITTLAFRDARNGAALGGDISQPDSVTNNVALTQDGGLTWTLAARPPFTGAAYGSSWVPRAPSPTLVTVGPKGLGYTVDEARSWVALDTLNHWGVSFAAPDRGWAVGPNGRITRLRLYARQGR
ncbi:MAG: WD40/YVTN/BNR-like repeat-containing protein, partial [Longimicrobiales bacterium]